MRIKNLIMLLSVFGLITACSEEATVIDSGRVGTPGEIQLEFSGSGDQVVYPGTRAIASDAENQIDKLDIYVFTSETENGIYYYLEKWESAASDDVANKNFALQGSGTTRKASIFPGELKSFPYIKLYCVANNANLFKSADGAAADALVPLTLDGDGNAVVAGVTDITTFESLATEAVATDPLATPLAMTGVGSTKIVGNYSLVKVELTRRVARFDIINDEATSRLTIEDISIKNARPASSLFKNDAVATAVIEYPETDFTLVRNANNGTAESAMYIHRTAAVDNAILIIKGQYKNPATGKKVPVHYELAVAKTPAPDDATPNPVPTNIEIESNHRYTLRIKDVTEAEIHAVFEVEDWTSGGGVIIKPDNDVAPEITAVTNGAGGAVIDPDWNEGDTRLIVTADGTFTITTLATSETYAVVENVTSIVTRAGTPSGWLKVENGNNKSVNVNGKTQTTMTFTVTGLASQTQIPATITLINKAASVDPELQTVLTVLPPATVPEVTLSTGYSSGKNKYDALTDPDAPFATIYKVRGSKIYFDVKCPYGAKVTSTMASGLYINKEVTNGFVETYSVTLTDVSKAVADQKLTVANAYDDTQLLEIALDFAETTVTVTDPSVAGKVSYDAAKSTVTVDYADIIADADKFFDLTIHSPEGVKTSVSNQSWFSVTEQTPFDTASGNTVYRVTLIEGAKSFLDAELTFENLIKDGSEVAVKIVKGDVVVP